jgi:AbrB family looped-hinge helix DNA binding protein
MPIVKTSAKGQIVIPAAIRKKLKIKHGQKVNLTLVEDNAVITPLPEDPIKSLRGILKGRPSMTKALLEDRKRLNVKKKILLDSFAVLAWLQNEKGSQHVEDLLYRAQGGNEQVLSNCLL